MNKETKSKCRHNIFVDGKCQLCGKPFIPQEKCGHTDEIHMEYGCGFTGSHPIEPSWESNYQSTFLIFLGQEVIEKGDLYVKENIREVYLECAKKAHGKLIKAAEEKARREVLQEAKDYIFQYSKKEGKLMWIRTGVVLSKLEELQAKTNK